MADSKELNIQKWRQNLVVLFVLLIASVFLIRLMTMQIVEGESYRSYLTEGYSVTKTVEASRGDIVDATEDFLQQTAFAMTLPLIRTTLLKTVKTRLFLNLPQFLKKTARNG